MIGCDFERTRAAAASDFVNPTIDLAFQQQLGLRLESKKVPTSVLVIDISNALRDSY